MTLHTLRSKNAAARALVATLALNFYENFFFITHTCTAVGGACRMRARAVMS
jgi:hypothetical protein